MDKAIDFSSISFGFLLAVLALLLQNTGPALKRIIEAGKFKELIKANKRAVIASAILSLIALIYLSLHMYDSKEIILGTSVELICSSICLLVFAFQVFELILFLDLFYFIIKQET